MRNCTHALCIHKHAPYSYSTHHLRRTRKRQPFLLTLQAHPNQLSFAAHAKAIPHAQSKSVLPPGLSRNRSAHCVNIFVGRHVLLFERGDAAKNAVQIFCDQSKIDRPTKTREDAAQVYLRSLESFEKRRLQLWKAWPRDESQPDLAFNTVRAQWHVPGKGKLARSS